MATKGYAHLDSVTGAVPIAEGGTANVTASAAFDALAPTTTRGDIIVRGASSNGRLALGSLGKLPISNGTDPVWDYPIKSIYNMTGFGLPSQASGGISMTGILGSSTQAGTLTTVSDTNGGPILNFATAASTNSDAGASAQAFNFRPFQDKGYYILKFALGTTTSVRFFLGFSSTGIATIDANDDPAGGTLCFGLQFSTNRADTNFQFMTDDNVTQTVTSTGIAVDTNYHFLILDCSATPAVTMSLLNASGVVQATSTFSTNLPAATTGMGQVLGLRTLANAAANFSMSFAQVQARIL